MEATTKKYLIYGGITLVLVYAGYRMLQPQADEAVSDIDPTGNGNYDPGAAAANFDPIKIADELYVAMNKMGTDTATVLSILGSLSQDKFGQVFNAFGKRTYNDATGNDFDPFGVVPVRDLVFWLKEELNASQIASYRLKFPNYIK